LGLLLIFNVSCSDSKVSELKQQLQRKNEDYKRLEKDFQSNQELNEVQYESLISIQRELAKLDSLSFTFRIKVEGRETTSYTMQQEIDTLISKIKNEIKLKDETIRQQSKTESKLRIVLETLTTQLGTKENEINRLKGVVGEQGKTISKQNNKIDELENSQTVLSKQINELETKKRDLESNMRYLESNMQRIRGDAYFDIGIAIENAGSNIPELSGIFISGAKKDEVLRIKNELMQQAKEAFQKSANFGNQKAKNKIY